MSFLGSDTKVNPVDNRVTLTDQARYVTGASIEAGGPKKIIFNTTSGGLVSALAVISAVGTVIWLAVWWWKRFNKS